MSREKLPPEELTELDESFQMCPRWHGHELTEEQIDLIATKAAAKAIQMARDDFYKDVGKTIVGRVHWMLGAMIVSLFVFLVSKGIIKL